MVESPTLPERAIMSQEIGEIERFFTQFHEAHEGVLLLFDRTVGFFSRETYRQRVKKWTNTTQEEQVLKEIEEQIQDYDRRYQGMKWYQKIWERGFGTYQENNLKKQWMEAKKYVASINKIFSSPLALPKQYDDVQTLTTEVTKQNYSFLPRAWRNKLSSLQNLVPRFQSFLKLQANVAKIIFANKEKLTTTAEEGYEETSAKESNGAEHLPVEPKTFKTHGDLMFSKSTKSTPAMAGESTAVSTETGKATFLPPTIVGSAFAHKYFGGKFLFQTKDSKAKEGVCVPPTALSSWSNDNTVLEDYAFTCGFLNWPLQQAQQPSWNKLYAAVEEKRRTYVARLGVKELFKVASAERKGVFAQMKEMLQTKVIIRLSKMFNKIEEKLKGGKEAKEEFRNKPLPQIPEKIPEPVQSAYDEGVHVREQLATWGAGVKQEQKSTQRVSLSIPPLTEEERICFYKQYMYCCAFFGVGNISEIKKNTKANLELLSTKLLKDVKELELKLKDLGERAQSLRPLFTSAQEMVEGACLTLKNVFSQLGVKPELNMEGLSGAISKEIGESFNQGQKHRTDLDEKLKTIERRKQRIADKKMEDLLKSLDAFTGLVTYSKPRRKDKDSSRSKSTSKGQDPIVQKAKAQAQSEKARLAEASVQSEAAKKEPRQEGSKERSASRTKDEGEFGLLKERAQIESAPVSKALIVIGGEPKANIPRQESSTKKRVNTPPRNWFSFSSSSSSSSSSTESTAKTKEKEKPRKTGTERCKELDNFGYFCGWLGINLKGKIDIAKIKSDYRKNVLIYHPDKVIQEVQPFPDYVEMLRREANVVFDGETQARDFFIDQYEGNESDFIPRDKKEENFIKSMYSMGESAKQIALAKLEVAKTRDHIGKLEEEKRQRPKKLAEERCKIEEKMAEQERQFKNELEKQRKEMLAMFERLQSGAVSKGTENSSWPVKTSVDSLPLSATDSRSESELKARDVSKKDVANSRASAPPASLIPIGEFGFFTALCGEPSVSPPPLVEETVANNPVQTNHQVVL